MLKYRIVEKDGKYKIQQRNLLLLWVFVSELTHSHHDDWYEDVVYDSIYSAQYKVACLISAKREERNNRKKKWNIVKYY